MLAIDTWSSCKGKFIFAFIFYFKKNIMIEIVSHSVLHNLGHFYFLLAFHINTFWE